MAKRKNEAWQFKFSSILAAVMLFLIIAYFSQSYNQMRKMKPVQAAIEHISSSGADENSAAEDTSTENSNE